MPIIPESHDADPILGENVVIPSSRDIPFFVDFDYQSDLDIPIAQCENIIANLHQLYNIVSYAHLSTYYHAFISSIDENNYFHSIPNSI